MKAHLQKQEDVGGSLALFPLRAQHRDAELVAIKRDTEKKRREGQIVCVVSLCVSLLYTLFLFPTEQSQKEGGARRLLDTASRERIGLEESGRDTTTWRRRSLSLFHWLTLFSIRIFFRLLLVLFLILRSQLSRNVTQFQPLLWNGRSCERENIGSPSKNRSQRY